MSQAEATNSKAFRFTPERAQAKISKGEMISSKEAQDRKTIGYTLVSLQGFLNLYHYYCSTTSTAPWLLPHQQSGWGGALGATGILLYQQGRDSQ